MAGRERRRSPIGVRAAARAALAILALASAALPAAAQDTPDDLARRMDDRFFFVRSLGRGWEPLLADFEAVTAELGEADRLPVHRVRDAAAEAYADLRVADGTEEGERRAFALYEMLSAQAVDAARHPEFARKCAQIEVTWAGRAEKAGDDAKALALALSAAKRSPGFEPAYDLIARLGLKEAAKAEARDDFFTALDVLSRSADLLPEGTVARGKIVEGRDRILATTGEVTVVWLGDAARLAQVRGPKSDFAQAALDFRPLEGQKAPPEQGAAKPMRLRNGRYAVSARGTGASPFDAGQVEVVSAGAEVTLIAALPENMVLVPATGGLDAFLIDRTEVTQSEFQNPGGGNVGGNRTAASGVNLTAARNYARAAGKDLPTLEQWFVAAFGDPAGKSRRYPWGDAAPQPGTHFVGGVEGPQSVDSCPSGASAFRCLNMGGNVMEWLADGRFIGGSYRRDSFSYEVQPKDDNGTPWTADFLRTPVPSIETYDAMSPADRDRYYNFRARDESTYGQVGLRCVVPLGKPRRNR